MSGLYMAIGVAGVGKSTALGRLTSTSVSSDAIREELFGYRSQENNDLVFRMLYARTAEVIKSGNTVYYDATNLNRSRRLHAIEEIGRQAKFKNLRDHTTAVVFIEPLSVIKARNAQRTGSARVPDEVLESMYKSMTMPRIGVDCRNIILINTTPFFRQPVSLDDLTNVPNVRAFLDLLSPEWYQEISKVLAPHDSPYHLESIDEHINLCLQHAGEHPWLRLVALFHDLGKGITKEGGHYYNHEKVSAMYAFLALTEATGDHTVRREISEVVARHMLMHREGLSDKVRRKNNISDREVRLLEEFAVIDDRSRRVEESLKG